MKQFLLILVFFCGSAFGADYHEYNYKVKQDNDYGTYRHTSLDTWHVEYGKKFGWLDVTYRYADLKITNEKRIKFTVPVFNYEKFSIQARMEYRSFDNLEDHWRYRFIFKYKEPITQNISAWIKLQPRWAFKNQQTKFDSRDQAGIEFKYKDFSFSPYIERYSKGELNNHNLTVFGTYLNIRYP